MQRRNGVYYFRKKVPTKLRGFLKRKEFVFSLKTKDALKAAVLTKLYAGEVEHQLREARMSIDFKNIKTFINKTKFDGNGQLIEAEKRVDAETINALRDSGLSAEDIAELVRLHLTSEVSEAIKVKQVSDKAEVSSEKSLLDLINAFSKKLVIKRECELPSEMTSKLRRLIEIIGSDTKISDMTISDADEVRSALYKLPQNSNLFRGSTVYDVIEKVDKHEIVEKKTINRLSAKQINNHLMLYSRVIRFAITKGWVKNDIFEDVRSSVEGDKSLRERVRQKAAGKEQFTSDDLNLIFSSQIFTDFGSSVYHENFNYWLPLIGLFSGTRIAQIASLDCSDIKLLGRIWVIDFNIDNTKKRSKTFKSIRCVPIHSKLLELGIVEFAKRVQKEGETRLFPELSAWSEKNGFSRRAGDWFRQKYLIKNLGFTKESRHSFHSFRRTLVTYMRVASIDEPTRNEIVGWDVNEDKANIVVREHYTDVVLPEIKLAVEKIDFSNELSRVNPFDKNKAIFGKRPGRNEHSK